MKFSKRFFIKPIRGSIKPPSNLPEVSNKPYLEFLETLELEVFKLIDFVNDGSISRDDLELLLIRLYPNSLKEKDINVMINEVDCNGIIRLEDLGSRIAASLNNNPPRRVPTELKEAFDFFDADHDGLISAKDLLKFFSSTIRYTLDDCKRMIANVDQNGDGFVCFNEFSRLMKNLN